MSRTLNDLYADRKRIQAICDRENRLPQGQQDWAKMNRCLDRIEILSAYIIYAEKGEAQAS